jgi:hypothetical protein
MPPHAPLSIAAISTLLALVTLVWTGPGLCELKAAEARSRWDESDPTIDPSRPYEPSMTLPPGRIAGLIELLARIEDADYGYSPYVSGTVFRGSISEAQPWALVLGCPEPTPDEAFRALVQAGPEAVPYLVAHLDDWRATRLVIRKGNSVWNLMLNTHSSSGTLGHAGREVDLTSYTIRIGDICYVALGQIVNRQYLACFYQPTGNVYITSPVHDASLLRALRDAWSALTPKSHEDCLLRDLRRCEFRGSAHGTLERLRCYYPKAVSPALRERFTAPRFCRRRLERVAIASLYSATDEDMPRKIAETGAACNQVALRDVVAIHSQYGPWSAQAARALRFFPEQPAHMVEPVSDESLLVLLHSLDRETAAEFHDLLPGLFDRVDSAGCVPACGDDLGAALAPFMAAFGRRDEARSWLNRRLRLIEESKDPDRNGHAIQQALQDLERRE